MSIGNMLFHTGPPKCGERSRIEKGLSVANNEAVRSVEIAVEERVYRHSVLGVSGVCRIASWILRGDVDWRVQPREGPPITVPPASFDCPYRLLFTGRHSDWPEEAGLPGPALFTGPATTPGKYVLRTEYGVHTNTIELLSTSDAWYTSWLIEIILRKF